MRVLAAMSGGVDSAVAAARAVDAGHEVVGVHLALSRCGRNPANRQPRLLHDRRLDGRPPCLDRTRHPVLRVGLLRAIPGRRHRRLHRLSTPRAAPPTRACAATRRSSSRRCSTAPWTSASTRSATGHYARRRERGRRHRAAPRIRRGEGPVVCAGRAQRAAARALLFPLGETPSKELVRQEAEQRGFALAQQARQPRHLLHSRRRHPRLPRREGGRGPRRHRRPSPARSIGSHEGAHAFTVGQRRGLQHRTSRLRRQAAVRARDQAQVSTRSSSAPRRRCRSTLVAGTRIAWAGPSRRSSTRAFDVRGADPCAR